MDWSSVKREHVEWAIKKYIEEDFEYSEPYLYYILYNDKKLPSNYIRGLAYEFATGEPLNLNGFNGEEDTVNFFKKFGYTVEKIHNAIRRKYLLVGDDISDLAIFEILNTFFDKDYKGYQKGWADLNSEYAAWFPKFEIINEAQDYSNELSSDGRSIVEIKHNGTEQSVNEDSKYHEKKRLVFGRINRKFQFLGVFKRSIVSGTEKLTYRYDQIAVGINLSSFELVQDTPLYDFSKISQLMDDFGLDNNYISSVMCQVGEKGTTVHYDENNNCILLYSTNDTSDAIRKAATMNGRTVVFSSVSLSKEDIEKRIIDERKKDCRNIICVTDGNKVLHPSQAVNYQPHEFILFTNSNLIRTLEIMGGGIPVTNLLFNKYDAVWVSAAVLSYKKYHKDGCRDIAEFRFQQKQIRDTAKQIIGTEVENARISQWCCGDHKNHSYSYLREVESSYRRLAFLGELDGREVPSALDETIELETSDGKITVKQLIDFVENEYSTMNTMKSQDINKQNLKDLIEKIFKEYSIEKENDFTDNQLANFLRNDAPGIVQTALSLPKDKDYYVKGSPGKGNWAKIPWVGVFNKKVAQSPQDGVYVIYLLSADCQTLYLTFNQGCSELSKTFGQDTPKILRERAKKMIPMLDNHGFKSDEDICLGESLNNRSELYQKGCVFYKSYEMKNLPNDEELRADLINMVKIYEQYIEKFVTFDKNIILYGPPGTGKTYNTAIYAVAICDQKSLIEIETMPYDKVLERYKELKDKEKRIAFTTFHQSYGYEEFIEGIKPKVECDSNDIEYIIKDGVFKSFCEKACQEKAETKSAKTRNGARVWCVILGGSKNRDLKQKCFKEGTIRIGGKSISEEVTYNTEGLNEQERRILLNFQDEMKVGDVVVVRSSASSVDGIGIVSGIAEYDNSVEQYPRKRKVDWLCYGEDIEIIDINGGIKLEIKSVYELSRISATDILSRIPVKPNVFIIDEINRGNISKIFGELITLIEPTKRKGADEAMEVVLPYSNKTFSVPNNVYIIGTMNTADRSIALMDTALRRRFQFIEKMPDANILRTIGADKVKDGNTELDVAAMLECINKRIEYLFDREHTIGHAFFTELKYKPTVEKLASIFKKSVIPLLQEYFYDDYSKIMLVLGDNDTQKEHKFIIATKTPKSSIFKGDISDIDIPDYSYCINDEAFNNIQSYIEIIG